ncbi:MAG: type II toxin-antitoxin system prevent-host-death family antitoxin [Phycicoccus sp.]|nr:type II toxin-antitoxin system prevent-host-death family antitoxin [Phycicoccus sp.]
MDTITHREMRNNSGEILRRVESGETVQVSNNGRPVALIVPINGHDLNALVARGEARAARTGSGSLATIVRANAGMPSQDIVADVRGPW